METSAVTSDDDGDEGVLGQESGMEDGELRMMMVTAGQMEPVSTETQQHVTEAELSTVTGE